MLAERSTGCTPASARFIGSKHLEDPFWVGGNGEQFSARDAAKDPGGHWVTAGDLRTGDRLQMPKGDGTVAVLDSSTRTELHTVYNLTVDGVHTYYIQTGDTDVLVHNCGSGEISPEVMNEHILPRHSLKQDSRYPEFSDKGNFAEGVTPTQIRQLARDAMTTGMDKISLNNGAHRHLLDVGREVGFEGERHVAVWVENGAVTSVHPEVP